MRPIETSQAPGIPPYAWEDIDDFFNTYRGGEEESKDLKEAYAKFDGDMDKVFMWVMCSDEKLDSHRQRESLDSTTACHSFASFFIISPTHQEAASLGMPTRGACVFFFFPFFFFFLVHTRSDRQR